MQRAAEMVSRQDDRRNVLDLLAKYSAEWSEILHGVAVEKNDSILSAITAESDTALREALSQIDTEIRGRQSHVPVAKSVGRFVDSNTEGTAGDSQGDDPESGGLTAVAFAASAPQDASGVRPAGIDQGQADHSGMHASSQSTNAANGRELPSVIGRYDIKSVLGRGGMGVVYRARQRGLKRDVALKMILCGSHANGELLARFRAEAEAVAKLQHPNIVQVYDIGEHEGLPYFSLEFVDGITLDQFRKSEPVAERKAAELIEVIARAMHFAHEAGIIHRDLKPANILLTSDGVPKVTDFGLVKRIDDAEMDSQTQSGSIMGTPHYMAPEQAWGRTDVSRPADIWAMGAILYALLTGRPPFAGANTVDTLILLRKSEPVSPRELLPSLSADLETICLTCLQKDTEKRYDTALELAEDIRRYLDGIPILARPVSRAERIWRWCRRNPGIAALSAAVVFAMISGTSVSATFAVSATNSARSEFQARQDADVKRIYAEHKEHEAAENAERAIQQRTIALGAFNTAVELAGTELKNLPGTEQFRSNLFEAAIQGFDRLEKIVGDDQPDFAMARGYSKTGEGLLEIGQAGKARSQFIKSHAILERLAQTETNANDAVHLLRLARSCRNIGRSESALSGPNAAVPWHLKALEMREQALPLHDDPLFVQQELAESCGDLGRAYLESGRPHAAAEILARGAGYRDEWLATAPTNAGALQEQAGLRHQIGTVQLSLGNTEAAISNLQMAVNLITPFTRQDKATSRDHLNLAMFRSALADALLFAGRNESAIAEYESSLPSLRMVREKNPNFVRGTKFHAGALYGLSIAEKRLGRPGAADHMTECVALRRRVLESATENTEYQRELMLALARAGQIEEAIGIADAQIESFANDNGILYQAACAYALAAAADDTESEISAGRAAAAVQLLEQAISSGHDGLAMMALDPDLESLRQRDDFQEMLRKHNSRRQRLATDHL